MSMTSLRLPAFLICLLIGVAVGSASFPLLAMAQAPVPPQMRSEAVAIMRLCRSDYDRLCSGVQPGGGRILACLQGHARALSPQCGQVMSRAQALKGSAAAAGVLPR
jgi:Cysteine rich repeat